ncbi:hypothetical protein [Methylomonas sp. AM2-LC]|uniref:hypothetical protein n=1 Tax=Methylomonas sp. AM2-LC TaxID=3153301 RepID=UPI003266CEB2
MKLSSKNLKFTQLSLGMALLLGAGQAALAHTGISNTIMSEANGYSNTITTHGCTVIGASNPTVSPVVAQSVVIPTQNPIVRSSLDTKTPINLGDYTNKTSLKNLFQLIQSHDVYTQQVEQNDAPNSGGNVIGWVSTKGTLGQYLYGLTPFRVSAIAINQASCVKSIKVNFAIAEICNKNSWPAGQAAPSVPGVNLWFDNDPTSDLYSGGLFGASTDQGADNTIAAASATLTINRDTTLKPYPSNCAGAGGTDPLFDILVYPGSQDIKKLQFPGWGTADPTYFY